MALSYLYNAIVLNKGEEAEICAAIADEAGTAVTENCSLMLHCKKRDEVLYMAEGTYNGEMWTFVLPKEVTADKEGRYFYCICQGERSLCSKEPIYFM